MKTVPRISETEWKLYKEDSEYGAPCSKFLKQACPSKARPDRALTLVKLLAVIAIIGGLAVLLLPPVSRAKAASDKVPFLNNHGLLFASARVEAGVFDERTLIVEGIISSAFLNNSGATVYERARRFRLQTDGIHYLARFEKPGENFDTDYIEQAFDGTNTYFLNTLPTWVKAQRNQGAKVGDNVGDASITGIAVPQNHFADSCGILWCAFLAGKRLQINRVQSGDIYYTPFPRGTKPAGGDYMENEFPKSKILWSGGRESVRLFLDEASFIVNTEGNSMAYTNAVFRTLEWQVLEGIRLPKLAEARILRNTADGSIRASYKMKVESAAFSTIKSSYVPELPGLTTVKEERFNSPEYDGNFHFNYFLTNRWLAKKEVEGFDQYKDLYKTLVGNPNTSSPKISPFVISLLAAFFLGGLLIYLKTRRG